MTSIKNVIKLNFKTFDYYFKKIYFGILWLPVFILFAVRLFSDTASKEYGDLIYIYLVLSLFMVLVYKTSFKFYMNIKARRITYFKAVIFFNIIVSFLFSFLVAITELSSINFWGIGYGIKLFLINLVISFLLETILFSLVLIFLSVKDKVWNIFMFFISAAAAGFFIYLMVYLINNYTDILFFMDSFEGFFSYLFNKIVLTALILVLEYFFIKKIKV